MVPNLVCFMWDILCNCGNEGNAISGNTFGASVTVCSDVMSFVSCICYNEPSE
jgi:hypothetical protein